MRGFVLGGSLLLLAACSSQADDTSTAGPLTDIQPTAAVQQTIPNCWDFATTGWLESLSLRPEGGKPIDLSEAYVSYWYWFAQVAYAHSTQIDPTGSWAYAIQVMYLAGFMTESDFLSQPGPVDFAVRHREALISLQLELQGGELRTPEQRSDLAHVRAVLNRVWQLSPQVADELNEVFGPGQPQWLDASTDLTGRHVHRLSEITVGYAVDGAAITAADLAGTPTDQLNIRAGEYAFSSIPVPENDADVRGYLRRAQKALDQGLPLPIALMQDDSLDDPTGTYRRPASSMLSNGAFAHLVTVFDLSVQTKDFGLLPAGVPETRPEALAASLLDDSQPIVFRARNTFWGSYDHPGASIPFAGSVGTNDYALDYLLMPLPNQHRRVMWGMTLPNNPDAIIAKSRPLK